MPSEEKHGPSNGHGGNGSRSRRKSQLMQAATALPTVESSLEEFIARANSTLVDVDQWEAEARAEKERTARQLVDAEQQRIRDAEEAVRRVAALERAQLESRIESLEGELADSQSRRAELEAKLAVLGTSSASDKQVADLEAKLAAAESRARAADARATAAEKDAARPVAALAPAAIADADSGKRIAELEARAKLAEGKVQKALAAARAASAGITVSNADLDKIEAGIGVHASGSAYASEPAVKKGLPMGAVVAAFIGGVAVMLIGVKLIGGGDKKAEAPAVQPTAAPAGAGVVEPVKTAPSAVAVEPAPVKTEPAPAAVAVEPAPVAVEPAPVAVEPAPVAIEPVKTEPAPVAVEPVKTEPVKTEPAKVTKAEPAKTTKTTKTEPAKTTKTTKTEPAKTTKTEPAKTTKTTKPAATGIVDPFGSPAPAEKPKTEKPKAKPATKPPAAKPGIVDPFAS